MTDPTLNADAIYAAMAEIRDEVESPGGQAAYRALLNDKSHKVDFFHSLARDTGAHVYIRPVFKLTEEQKDDIFPGDPVSVDVGVELARTILFGPSGIVDALLSGDHQDPVYIAVHRFLSDRAQ